MVEIKKQETKEVNLEDNPNEFTSYANVSLLSISPEEVVLQFGLKNSANSSKAKSIAKIYLSLPHTKRIVNVLALLIRQYEEMFGEIDADPGAKMAESKGNLIESIKKEENI